MSEDKKYLYEFCMITESHIFCIAVLLIVLIGILLILYFPVDQQLRQGILTSILTWMGAIIGFYFGQKPVSEVVSRLQEKEKKIMDISDKSKELFVLSKHYQELLDKTIEKAQSLNVERK